MLSSSSIPTTDQDALNNGISLFLSGDASQYSQMTTHWQAALPAIKDKLAEFLKQQEDKLLQSFFDSSDMTFVPPPQAEVAKWEPRLKNYYEHRSQSDEIENILGQRELHYVGQNVYSPLDDYQLLRESNNLALHNKRLSAQKNLATLFALNEGYAVVNQHDLTDVIKDSYLLDKIFALLFTLDQRLQKHHDSYKKAKAPTVALLSGPESDSEPADMEDAEASSESASDSSDELVQADKPAGTDTLNEEQLEWLYSRFDALTYTIAQYLLTAMRQEKISRHPTFFADLKKRIGRLEREVIPWLSIAIRNEIVMEMQDENTLIREYLAYQNQTTLAESMAKISGAMNLNTIKIAGLKIEKYDWKAIENKPLPVMLARIAKYQLKSSPCDAVTLRISQALLVQSKEHGHELQFSLTAYKFIRHILLNHFYLTETTRYLRGLYSQSQTDQKLQTQCPAIYLAVAPTGVQLSQMMFLKYYPPSASLFYAAWADEAIQPVLLERLKGFTTVELQNYFTAIFADEDFREEHNAFFITEPARQLGLHPNNFPLVTLRLFYSSQMEAENCLGLWDVLLDSNALVESRFFEERENVALFEKIHVYYSPQNIPAADLILENSARYRNLAVALCNYNYMIGNPAVSNWADKVYATILHGVAFPRGDKKINFDNIVKFLDLKLDAPVTKTDLKDTPSQAQELVLDFYFNNPDCSAPIIRKFIFDIMNWHNSYNDKFQFAKHEKLFLTDINQVPVASVCLLWTDYSTLSFANITPIFISPAKSSANEIKIQRFSSLVSANRSIKQVFGVAKDSDPDVVRMVNSIRFSLGIYYAYCQRHINEILQSEQKTLVCYLDFLLNYEIPAAIKDQYKSLMENLDNFYKNDKTKVAFLQIPEEEVTKQEKHCSGLISQFSECISHLSDPAKIIALEIELARLIETKEFNKGVFFTNPYHVFLKDFNGLLQKLKIWQGEQLKHLSIPSNRTEMQLSSQLINSRLASSGGERVRRREDMNIVITIQAAINPEPEAEMKEDEELLRTDTPRQRRFT